MDTNVNEVMETATEVTEAAVDAGLSKAGCFGLGVLCGALALWGIQMIGAKVTKKAVTDLEEEYQDDVTVNPTEVTEDDN